MSELTSITGTEDSNGLFRAFNDKDATNLTAHFTLGFDALPDREEALFGIEARIFRNERLFASNLFTSPSRSRLIEMLKSEEELKQLVLLAVEAQVKARKI